MLRICLNPPPRYLSGDYIKVAKIVAVVAVACMMLTVPFSFADDSDAYTDGSVGAYFTADDDLTKDEYLALTGDTNYSDILSLSSVLDDFNYSVDEIEVDFDVYSLGNGEKVEGKTESIMNYQAISASFTVKLTVTSDSEALINESITVDVDELKAYLGVDKFSIGDKMEITGDVWGISESSQTVTYVDISSDACTQSVGSMGAKYDIKCNLDVKYLPGGDATATKTFTLNNSTSMNFSYSNELSVDGAYSDIAVGDPYTVTPTLNLDVPVNSLRIGFDGKECSGKLDTSMYTEFFPVEPIEGVFDEYDFKDPSEIVPPSEPMTLEDLFDDSSLSLTELNAKAEECGSYGVTYDGMKAEASRIADEFDGDDDDGLNLPLVIGGVVVGVLVIAGIAFFFIKRRS